MLHLGKGYKKSKKKYTLSYVHCLLTSMMHYHYTQIVVTYLSKGDGIWVGTVLRHIY